jgi:hypothetical protein
MGDRNWFKIVLIIGRGFLTPQISMMVEAVRRCDDPSKNQCRDGQPFFISILHDIFCVGNSAEHVVGNRKQERSIFEKSL